jgi:hypothetical protein
MEKPATNRCYEYWVVVVVEWGLDSFMFGTL